MRHGTSRMRLSGCSRSRSRFVSFRTACNVQHASCNMRHATYSISCVKACTFSRTEHRASCKRATHNASRVQRKVPHSHTHQCPHGHVVCCASHVSAHRIVQVRDAAVALHAVGVERVRRTRSRLLRRLRNSAHATCCNVMLPHVAACCVAYGCMPHVACCNMLHVACHMDSSAPQWPTGRTLPRSIMRRPHGHRVVRDALWSTQDIYRAGYRLVVRRCRARILRPSRM